MWIAALARTVVDTERLAYARGAAEMLGSPSGLSDCSTVQHVIPLWISVYGRLVATARRCLALAESALLRAGAIPTHYGTRGQMRTCVITAGDVKSMKAPVARMGVLKLAPPLCA